jgi:hypothetical protein
MPQIAFYRLSHRLVEKTPAYKNSPTERDPFVGRVLHPDSVFGLAEWR